MLISELIVILWCVPVVFFIIIPLSMLGLWSIYNLVRKITDQIEQTHRFAKKSFSLPPVKRLRHKHAV